MAILKNTSRKMGKTREKIIRSESSQRRTMSRAENPPKRYPFSQAGIQEMSTPSEGSGARKGRLMPQSMCLGQNIKWSGKSANSSQRKRQQRINQP